MYIKSKGRFYIGGFILLKFIVQGFLTIEVEAIMLQNLPHILLLISQKITYYSHPFILLFSIWLNEF